MFAKYFYHVAISEQGENGQNPYLLVQEAYLSHEVFDDKLVANAE